ncbi:hypothetical protein [Fluviicola taffensis]|uniref:hypothetical protein n=1 Tax=Fluviicola taffensis TaxID=191579 RepID=UPI00313808DA
MKLVLITCLISISCYSYSQVNIIRPSIQYVSKWQLESINWMKIGSRVLFRQECTTSLPPEFPTGVVFFENVFNKDDRFSMAVEFKDTVVVSVTYYLSAKQKNLLETIGYSDINANGSTIKGQWIYVLNEKTMHTTIVGDKKRIVIVQTL